MEDNEQVFSLNIQNELLALTECSDKTLNIFWKQERLGVSEMK